VTTDSLGMRPSRPITGAAIRELILDQAHRAHVGHIASALSVADLVAVLFDQVLRIPAVTDPERDRLILSKGHAALALYAALYVRGTLDQAQLNTYCTGTTLLGVHPEKDLTGVDFSTGSLGHGLSIGAGVAYAARLDNSTRRVFVLMSDAECNEGSVWEAAAFAAHHRLAGLVGIVDLNGQQALGFTQDVLDMSNMEQRWQAFGWQTHTVDGHDPEQLELVLRTVRSAENGPNIVIARTTAGKGVSFMERQIKWHYLPMSEEEYRRALSEVSPSR